MPELAGLDFGGVSWVGVLFLCAAALLAGAVDAIVGGGGLLQLPALLVVMPGGHVIHSIATSKVVGTIGAAATGFTYSRKTPMDWGTVARMSSAGFLAAMAGAACASALPAAALNVVVLVALLLVVVHTVRNPDLGMAERTHGTRTVVAVLGGAAIGFWNGLGAPGTGSFLVFLLVGLAGHSFLSASAIAKVVNVATSLGALLFFIPAGTVLWGLGIAMAVCNVVGGVVGTLIAVRRGATFIRRVFLAVAIALIATVGVKLLG
ncbi:TSUP family transporter [Allokutzneria sp. NRRL B-24872]|uniref:sulfite exporter TauE/SafE family protein n=1 Tax=Allokutzneria sp. NRRL B-24872 TaxID=1137961 RepID=UPI001FEEF2F7|nr:TSUP family transporter [Allokutzneria sp. NRRL B-24872]